MFIYKLQFVYTANILVMNPIAVSYKGKNNNTSVYSSSSNLSIGESYAFHGLDPLFFATPYALFMEIYFHQRNALYMVYGTKHFLKRKISAGEE